MYTSHSTDAALASSSDNALLYYSVVHHRPRCKIALYFWFHSRVEKTKGARAPQFY